jgi:hypothetical protein
MSERLEDAMENVENYLDAALEIIAASKVLGGRSDTLVVHIAAMLQRELLGLEDKP